MKSERLSRLWGKRKRKGKDHLHEVEVVQSLRGEGGGDGVKRGEKSHPHEVNVVKPVGAAGGILYSR